MPRGLLAMASRIPLIVHREVKAVLSTPNDVGSHWSSMTTGDVSDGGRFLEPSVYHSTLSTRGDKKIPDLTLGEHHRCGDKAGAMVF